MSKHHRFIYKDDEAMEKPFDYAVLVRLLQFLKPHRKKLLPLVIFMTIIGAGAKLTIPLLLWGAVDNAIADGNVDLLIKYIGGMVGLYLLQWGSNTIRIYLTNVMGQQVIFDIREKLFKHIQRLSFRFFDQRPAGSILVRITNDVNSLQDLLTNGIVNLMIDLLQISGIVVILMFINWQLGLAVMVTVPLMFFVSTQLRKRTRRAWQTVRIKQSRLNSHLNESIQGMRVTQAYTQETPNMGYFQGMNEGNRRSWNKASALNMAMGPLVEVTSGIGMCILFWYGAYMIQSEAITIGVLIAFAQYIGNFWEPINRLGQMYSQLLIAMASCERIFEFLDERPSVSEREEAQIMPAIIGDVSLEQVVFEYEKGRPALKGIDLEVHAGQTIALVGHTGSGKSTIINLLSRFYDPVGGQVKIDGRDIRDFNIESLRQQIGIVLQDTFIFSGSIRDNIRYGRLNATDEEIEMAAKAVNAHDFIVKLPHGYDTEVEERGNMLSMGQKQLISFTRALLADPKILILDEATASIDTETEVIIQEAMKTLLSGRTSFIVAHRLSTIRHADKIVVLDHGEIKEIGNHDELMQHKGIYHGLIEAQYRYLEAI